MKHTPIKIMEKIEELRSMIEKNEGQMLCIVSYPTQNTSEDGYQEMNTMIYGYDKKLIPTIAGAMEADRDLYRVLIAAINIEPPKSRDIK